MWQYLVILALILFIIYLATKLYITTTQIHEITYSLLFQVIILRDMALMYRINTDIFEKLTNLRLQSFWPQGRVGSYLIDRHQLFVEYVKLLTNSHVPPQSRNELKSRISAIDTQVNKFVHFDMQRVSMYTFSMIENTIKGNQIDSILAVKGLIYTVQ